MRERHYLGFRNFCGKRLRQVAVHGERWLALIGWHAAALHCAARDRWIGWSSLQRRQRLFLVANQSRFLLLSEAGSSPHLASRVLGLSLRQLPRAALGRIVCGSGTLRWNLLPRRQLARGRRHARLRARARRRDRLSAPRRAQARVRLPAAARRAAATRGRAGASPPGGHTNPGSCSTMLNGAPCAASSTKSPTRAAAAACAIRCAPRWRSCLDRAWPVVRH